jgi:transposase
MRLPRILNQCHPIPGFVYGKASFAEDEQAVLIAVRPRKRSAAICSGCHQPASGYDQSPTPRRFEFIGFWGYLVFLVYCMRRVNCKQCGVLVEEVPWGMGKHASTKVHMHFLGHWARKLSWKETAEEFRTSWDKVHDAVEYLVTWGLEHRVLGAIRAIGVDEIQRGKGHIVNKSRDKRRAVRKMEVDPPESPCGGRLQTAMSCYGRTAAVVNVMVKRRGILDHVMWERERRAQANRW